MTNSRKVLIFVLTLGITSVLPMLLPNPLWGDSRSPAVLGDPTTWNTYAVSVQNESNAQEKESTDAWAERSKRIETLWGKLAEFPEVKRYVDYSNHERSRIQVDYESGDIEAEILVDPDQKTSRSDVQAQLNAVITSAISKEQGSQAILMPQEVAQDPTVMEKISQDLRSETLHGDDGTDRTIYRMSFKMVPDHIKKRAEAFQPIVSKWASKYGLDSAYVLAIIRQESSFNPRARSWVPAYGLMQIVPKYAGQEVMKVVTGKESVPDEDYLYVPEQNVMVGTTYLQLLRDQYFPEIKDSAKRLYLITASYNWGPNRVRAALDSGRLPAQEATSQQVFDRLEEIVPYETRNYLRKVTEYAIEFKKEGF